MCVVPRFFAAGRTFFKGDPARKIGAALECSGDVFGNAVDVLAAAGGAMGDSELICGLAHRARLEEIRK